VKAILVYESAPRSQGGPIRTMRATGIWRSRSRGARRSSGAGSCGTKLVVNEAAHRRLAVQKDKLAGHWSRVEGHKQRTVISATNLIKKIHRFRLSHGDWLLIHHEQVSPPAYSAEPIRRG
jgi:hypothetical protein